MIPLALRLIESARLVHGDAEQAISGLVVDSRSLRPGSLFACLPGTRADGHDFLGEAAARGASAVLCAPGRAPLSGPPAALDTDDPLVVLAEIGRLVRERAAARVVGVAGSAGKTTLKDVLRALLAPHMRTVASSASHNNELGVPLTLALLERETAVCVCELGTGAPGELAALCATARPDIGVLTAIGPEHLEFFGTVEGVAAEEAALVASLPAGASVVLPATEPLLEPYRRADLDEWTFGLDEWADVQVLAWRRRMSAEAILYLSGRDVAAALERVDPIAAVAAALTAHGRGNTILPAEAYLAWEHDGAALRSLSMPGRIDSLPGVKIINANPANPDRGLQRASGLTVLFDDGTGRPFCILQGSRISCVRTAAVTAIAAELLATPPVERLALIGAGALCRCHLVLLAPRFPGLREVRVYDVDRRRASALSVHGGASLVVCDSPEEAIRGAELIVPVTTATTGYIRHAWLEPGALLVNVSLDDPLPEVVLRADRLFVDDWSLVAADERRLLGRMLRQGMLCGPGERGARAVDGELGELLTGRVQGRSHAREIIVVNPFGLAIEDLALAGEVYRHARACGLGRKLEC